MPDIEFSIAKLECKPGDTILFKVKGLDQALATVPNRVAAFEEHLQKFMPAGTKSLLIDSDMEVTVLSVEPDVRMTSMSNEEISALLKRNDEFTRKAIASCDKAMNLACDTAEDIANKPCND